MPPTNVAQKFPRTLDVPHYSDALRELKRTSPAMPDTRTPVWAMCPPRLPTGMGLWRLLLPAAVVGVALRLGAQAVSMATRCFARDEAPRPQGYQEWAMQSMAEGAIVSM